MAKQENNTQTVTATIKLLNKEYESYTCLAEDANHKKITYNIKLRIIGTTGVFKLLLSFSLFLFSCRCCVC